MDNHIDNNTIVSDFLVKTSVDNENTIDNDDEIPRIAENVSYRRRQYAVIQILSRLVITIPSDVV